MNAVQAVAFDFNGTLSQDEPILSDVDRRALLGATGLRCVAVLGTHRVERLRAADEIVEAIDVDVVARPAPVTLV